MFVYWKIFSREAESASAKDRPRNGNSKAYPHHEILKKAEGLKTDPCLFKFKSLSERTSSGILFCMAVAFRFGQLCVQLQAAFEVIGCLGIPVKDGIGLYQIDS